MKRFAPALVAISLLAVAGPAAPQPAAPQPPAPSQPPERTTAPRDSGLNLKLDESDLRSLSRNTPAPRDQSSAPGADGLPSLGGDARSFGDQRSPDRAPARSPYPKDTQVH